MKTDAYIQYEAEFDFNKYSEISPDMKNTIIIDLVDACNLSCVTCPRGLRLMRNKRVQMDFDLFKKIIDKAKFLGFKHIAFYSWTEPFLCRDISRYISYAKNTGLNCSISSNLSFRDIPELIPTLKYLDKLIISLSGFSQATYKINHRGGNIALVKSNLEKISRAKMAGIINTQVIIHYFNYPYTLFEFLKFKQYTDNLGLEICLWKGGGDPLLDKQDNLDKVKNMHYINKGSQLSG